MKTFPKYSSIILGGLSSIFIILYIFIIVYQIENGVKIIKKEVSPLLKNAVKIAVDRKMLNIAYTTHYDYDPQKGKIGDYIIKVAKYADTTFTYKSKIVDPATDVFNGLQTVLLEMNVLSPHHIQEVFDSLLIEKNIHVKSVIGITSSIRTKKNQWSGDTTALHTNYSTILPNQGKYEDINYHANIHYRSDTLWKLIPKKSIYITPILSLILLYIFIWWINSHSKKRERKIELLQNSNFIFPQNIDNSKEKIYIFNGKEVKLTEQLDELLLLFIKTEGYKVSKIDIRNKFWPHHINNIGNMTSAINRLNKLLKEKNSIYIIITDPSDVRYYLLSHANFGKNKPIISTLAFHSQS